MTLEEQIESAFDIAERHTKHKLRGDFNLAQNYMDIFFDAFRDLLVPILRKRMEEENETPTENLLLDEHHSGFMEGLAASKICARCKRRTALSVHHIRPRSQGGEDNPENLIALCFPCHDHVEFLTDELHLNDHQYTTESLESFIINGFPFEERSRTLPDAQGREKRERGHS